jgi:hypothetical protein
MAYTIPNNDVAYDPNQSRWMSTDIDILTAGLAGVGVVSGCAVTAQGSPDMTVAIATGVIRIASGAQVAVTSGNGTITTANATNPRIDLVSVSEAGTKTVTAGTAAASPKPPDLPSGNVALAMVYVPANDTTIATNQITDKRVVLPGNEAARELGYAQITADVTTTSTSLVDATGLSVTVTVGGRPIIVEFWTGEGRTTNTTDKRILCELYDATGSTQLSFGLITCPVTDSGDTLHVKARLTPAAGSRTYKVRFETIAAGTATIRASSASPAFIRVYEV